MGPYLDLKNKKATRKKKTVESLLSHTKLNLDSKNEGYFYGAQSFKNKTLKARRQSSSLTPNFLKVPILESISKHQPKHMYSKNRTNTQISYLPSIKSSLNYPKKEELSDSKKKRTTGHSLEGVSKSLIQKIVKIKKASPPNNFFQTKKESQEGRHIKAGAEAIFKCLTNKTEEIRANQVVELIVSLALSREPQVVLEVLESCLEFLGKQTFSLDDIVSCCDPNCSILKKLNCLYIEKHTEDSIPKTESLRVKSIKKMGLALLREKRKGRFIETSRNIDELYSILTAHWKKYDFQLKGLSCKEVIQILLELSVAYNVSEAKSILKQYQLYKSHLTFKEFLKVFSKSLLKNLVMGVAEALQQSSTKQEYSSTLKIQRIKRRLLIKEIETGSCSTLEAIGSFHRLNKSLNT